MHGVDEEVRAIAVDYPKLDDELIRKAYQLVILKGETPPAAALKWLTTEGVQAEKEQQELAKP